jgi:hypothetical protein
MKSNARDPSRLYGEVRGVSRNAEIPLSVLAVLLFALITASCGSPSQSPELANGWVTNCSGPDFRKFSPPNRGGPGPARPVFKINDRLVLAVPSGNWPSAGRINREPYKCSSVSDLSNVPYLYFVIQGNWSKDAGQNESPLNFRDKEVIPDAVTVRVERYQVLSPSDQADRDQVADKTANEMADKHEVGGLICGRFVVAPYPNYQGGMLCWTPRRPSESDELRITTAINLKRSPLVFIDAVNRSRRYGGILIYWQVSTSDLEHALDIDQTIWKTLSDWNLVESNDGAPSKH